MLMQSKLASITAHAPARTSDVDDWTNRSACRRVDPEIFFPTSATVQAQMPAKKICAGCPVREICLEYGMGDKDSRRYGIYGGLTGEERLKLDRDNRNARRREERRKAARAKADRDKLSGRKAV